MTEAEAYELFTLIAEHQNQLLFAYFSVVTAFLLMTYFVAEKLDRYLALIVVSLYTLCCLWFFGGLYGWTNDLALIYADMLQKNQRESMSWLGSVLTRNG